MSDRRLSMFRHRFAKELVTDFDRTRRDQSLDVIRACRDAMLDMEISKLRTQMIPSSVACNTTTLEYLKSFVGHSASDGPSFSSISRVMADASGLSGMPIVVDEALADGEVEARRRDGTVLIRFHLGQSGGK